MGLLLNKKYSGVENAIEGFLHGIRPAANSRLNFDVLLSKTYEGKLQDRPWFRLTRVPFDTSNKINRVVWENFKLPVYLKNKSKKNHLPLPNVWSCLTVCRPRPS